LIVASFVLLLSGDASEASAGELGRRTERQAAWVTELRAAGCLADGGRIAGRSVRVRVARGRSAVIDVPPDVIGSVRSWLLVEADDLPAAVALAESCPEAVYGDVRVLAVDA